MPELVWISDTMPRRLLAVRMTSSDDLPELPFDESFGALGVAFDRDGRPHHAERLCEQIDDAGAYAGIEVTGPGAWSWDEHAVLCHYETAIGDDVHSFVEFMGMPLNVMHLVVFCFDGDNADWREVRTHCENSLASTTDTRLHFAAGQGELENVRFAIEQRWPLEDFDPVLAWTPLHQAAKDGQLEAMKLLLDAGVDVNKHCEQRTGETPLGEVAPDCSLEVAQLLIDAGADPCIPGSLQITALQSAAERQDADGNAVYALLKKQAERLHGRNTCR